LTKSSWSRLITIAGATLVALSLVLGLMPSTASSATGQVFTAKSSAQALQLQLAGGDLLAPDPRIADTTLTPQVFGPTIGAILDLPLLPNVSVGVLAQDAAASDTTGNSIACSGLVGPGGQISVTVDPQVCNVDDPPGANGLVVDLLPLGLLRLRVDAVYAECTANAAGGVTGQVHLVNAALELANIIPIFPPTLFPIALPVPGPNSSVLPAGLAFLSPIISITANEQIAVPAGEIDVTALHVTVLGLPGSDPLVDLKVGKVHCGRNTVSTASIDFDTSGSHSGNDVQPQTENALALSYTPDVARPAVTLAARVGPNLTVDVARGLPAGCDLSIDGTTDPDTPVVTCALGAVAANTTVTRVIPIEIENDVVAPITATLIVFGGSVNEILGDPVVETAGVFVESTQVSGNAGGLAVPNPNRTGLPNDILGSLYLSLPPYVEEAAYGGTPCTLAPAFNPAPSVYPAIAANNEWTCGTAIAPPSEAALAFTYAASAPMTTGDGDPGHVLIIRGGQGGPPAQIPDNSYYSDLAFFVGQVPPTTTTTSSTTTTSTTVASTTSTTAAATTSSTAAATTSSTAASTTSSTAASTTSSTAASSTTAAATTTTAKAAPLAKTGSNTRTTLSVAMGLLGVGMVVAGRGMVLADLPTRRRRR